MEISVIVPIYNKEKHIRSLLKSIKKQTYEDFELILVNDGSTDKSMEIVEEELKDSKCKYTVIKKENGGQSTARNRGIKEAKGKWIVMLDSDDAIQKDYLKILFESVKNCEADVGICDIKMVDDCNILSESERTHKLEIKDGKEFFKDFILHKISIGPCSLMIKKDLLDEYNIKFNEKSRYSEEFIFITELLYNANKVVHVKEELYNYCLRSGSVSTGANIEKIINGYKQIEKYSEKYKDNINNYEEIYNKYALPRWILATARFTAENMNYDSYKKLMMQLNAKNKIKQLISFPDLKTKIAAITFGISQKLFYNISK